MIHRSIILCLSLMAVPAWCGGADWTVDPKHSRLGFVATWEGSEFEGLFRRFDALIRFDPKHPHNGRFQVEVDVTSVDTASSDRDEALSQPAWFDFLRYPKAHFVTSAMRATGPSSFEAEGQLTIKGRRRPLRLPFTWRPRPDGADLTASVTLQRTDFGIGQGEWSSGDVIGLEVRVMVDLSLYRRASE